MGRLVRFLSDFTGNRYNDGCGAVLVADIVLDNQQRSHTALLGADGRIEVGVIKNTLRRSIANKSPLYCNYLKFYEYDAEQIARAMNSDINLITLKISHLIEMGYNLRGIECNSRFLR